ncbi:hypothetical protein [Nannocystis punicea]|uniref:Lipoprotein n=1 Tax=Nannocystis punicea TaxID=2995304 RepID=A0ABY7HJC0_9BACT|nr:hypothetical protein [Nannocystis poenicansa]WAS99433.1 hypothetical protein O0S08_25185 [Nannocystis poenicansa]
MFARPVLALAALLLASPGCGPEIEQLPPSGIYRMTAVTLANDCHPTLDDDHMGEEVVQVTAEWIKVPHVDPLGLSLASYAFTQVNRDPEAGEYAHEWPGSGCRRLERLEVEPVDADTVRSRITDEWRDDGSCAWAGEACTVVRDYTYELVEACDDCEFPLHLDQ